MHLGDGPVIFLAIPCYSLIKNYGGLMAKRTIKAPITMKLKPNERKKLKELVTKGSAKAREIRRANVLLMSNKKKTPKEISETLDINKRTIQNIFVAL